MAEASPLPKLIVLLQPTASGKTRWGIELARQFGGEIISADSRQIYKKMLIGTGKEPGEWRPHPTAGYAYDIEGIPHFLLDIADPGHFFTVTEFRDAAVAAIGAVREAGHMPFLVGGTGLYISSLINNLNIPQVPPNKKLRQSLERKSLEHLLKLLKELDPESYGVIDKKNKRRVLRALEVCILTGEPFSKLRQRGEPLFDVLQIGIDIPKDALHARIDARIDGMIAAGLEAEVRALLAQKYAWQLPSMSGIGYRQWKEYTEGTATLADVAESMKRETYRYARRQMTWFRRDPRIIWCRTLGEAKERVALFLSKT